MACESRYEPPIALRVTNRTHLQAIALKLRPIKRNNPFKKTLARSDLTAGLTG
jgi:hypothetical protein